MTIDSLVVVTYALSTFYGRRGRIRSLNPTKVRLEGEVIDLMFGFESLAPLSEPTHIGGAE